MLELLTIILLNKILNRLRDIMSMTGNILTSNVLTSGEEKFTSRQAPCFPKLSLYFRLNRVVSETIQIKGLTLSKGQTIFIPVMAIHRNPQLYKDPDSFKPERYGSTS